MWRFYSSIILVCCLISACSQPKNPHEMHFSTSAEYPPFEYIENNQIKGFDIDLAQLIAQQLGKKAVFDNMQFSTVLPAVSSGQDEAAISTITITDERKQNFDFSQPYYFEGMAVVYKNNVAIHSSGQLKGKKVAVQLGSVMEIWAKQHLPAEAVIALDNNNLAIEALLADHVDAVLLDGAQGAVFSSKHANLGYSIIDQAKDGYGIALAKNSPLTAQINQALAHLQKTGELDQLKAKWLGVKQ